MNNRILTLFKAGGIATAAAAAVMMPGVASAQAATVSPNSCSVNATPNTAATADVYQDLEGFIAHPTCFND
jgi:pyridoxal biosynthesis lyase PdxS